jgi:hypothetical protein
MERIADLKKISQTEKENSNIAEIIIIVQVIRSDHSSDKLSAISNSFFCA